MQPRSVVGSDKKISLIMADRVEGCWIFNMPLPEAIYRRLDFGINLSNDCEIAPSRETTENQSIKSEKAYDRRCVALRKRGIRRWHVRSSFSLSVPHFLLVKRKDNFGAKHLHHALTDCCFLRSICWSLGYASLIIRSWTEYSCFWLITKLFPRRIYNLSYTAIGLGS